MGSICIWIRIKKWESGQVEHKHKRYDVPTCLQIYHATFIAEEFEEKTREETPLRKKKILKLDAIDIQMYEQNGFSVGNFLTIHTEFFSHGVLYKSLNSKVTSRIDYFIKSKSGMLCAVEYYVTFDSILYAVVEKYNVSEIYDHLIEVTRTHKKEIIQANDILKKMIFLKYGLRQFVTSFPNNFEKT